MRGRSSILGVGTLHGLALTLAGLLLVSAAACGSEDSGRREDTTDTSADTNGPDTSETVSPDTSEDTAEASGEVVAERRAACSAQEVHGDASSAAREAGTYRAHMADEQRSDAPQALGSPTESKPLGALAPNRPSGGPCPTLSRPAARGHVSP
jgi:hypothetical protein